MLNKSLKSNIREILNDKVFRIIMSFMALILVFFLAFLSARYLNTLENDQKVEALKQEINNRVLSDDEMGVLNTLIKSPLITKELKGKATYLLSYNYDLNGEFENSVNLLYDSIYYYSQAKNYFQITKEYVDLAAIFITYGQYDAAINSIGKAFEVKYSGEKAKFLNAYAYLNLAEAYSYKGDMESTIEYIDKFNETEEFLMDDQDMLLDMIKVRALLLNDKIEEAVSIINTLDFDNVMETPIVASNIYIPYYEIQTLYYFKIGEFQLGGEYFDLLTSTYSTQYANGRQLNLIRNLLQQDNVVNSDYCSELMNYQLKLCDDAYVTVNNSFSEYLLEENTANLNLLLNGDEKVFLCITMAIIILISLFVILFVFALLQKALVDTNIDGLTGIYNKKYLIEEYDRFKKLKTSFCVIMLDIDFFKKINDTYGHDYGDKVLKKVAKTINNCLSDKDDKVFRFGGEEFCVICKEYKIDEVKKAMEKMRVAIEALSWDYDIVVTVSIGGAISHMDDDALKVADNNLYYSKQNGRNRYTI